MTSTSRSRHAQQTFSGDIDFGHRRRRHRSRGDRRGPQGPRAAAPDGVKFEQTRYDLGAERYLATGEVLPDSVLAEIREHDAILLGAVGGRPNDPNLPPGILERGLLLRLRFELDQYVNLRPSKIYPGVARRSRPRRGRLRGRPRGHRGPLHRQRRRAARRHPARDRHRGQRQHGVRRGAGRPRRLRPRRSAARARSSPSSTRPTCWSTPAPLWSRLVQEVAPEFPDVTRLHPRRRRDDLHDHRPGPLRRDRHRQPVRRHHHRPRRRHHRRHRAGRLRQHQPRPHRARACSSRCTARPPTSPASEGQPDRGDPVGVDDARPPRATPTRPPRRAAVIADLRRASTRARPGVPPRSATRSPRGGR